MNITEQPREFNHFQNIVTQRRIFLVPHVANNRAAARQGQRPYLAYLRRPRAKNVAFASEDGTFLTHVADGV